MTGFTMLILPSIILATLSVCVQCAPLVKSSWGQIQGVDNVSVNGLGYSGYFGIPYAKPPTGDLRFKAPQPHSGVEGTFSATEYGPICPQQQISSNTKDRDLIESEDCLTLNVFAPKHNSGPKDVMVFIHGGSFGIGSARMVEPDLIVTKCDVIGVSIQYRLSAFGFLSSGNDILPGNFGLWDQYLAIKWVKDNIEAFGGDPTKITLIGQSAGAIGIGMLTLYPGSKDLFQRAILRSGSASTMSALNRNPERYFMSLAKELDCKSLDSNARLKQKAMLKCIKSKSGEEIMKASNYVNREGNKAFPVTSVWVPVVDGIFLKQEPRIVLGDEQLLAETSLYDIDVMVGVNNNEGGVLYITKQLFRPDQCDKVFEQGFYDKNIVDAAADLALGEHDPKINDIIRVLYSYPRSPADQRIPQKQLLDTYSDPVFLMPAQLFASAHAKKSTKRTFFYIFNHFPTFKKSISLKGMVHGMDYPYLYGLETEQMSMFEIQVGKEEEELSDTFVRFLAAFAKTGDPNSVVESKLGEKWPQYNGKDRKYLSFTTNMSVQSNLYPERTSLWLHVIPNLMKRWKGPARQSCSARSHISDQFCP